MSQISNDYNFYPDSSSSNYNVNKNEPSGLPSESSEFNKIGSDSTSFGKLAHTENVILRSAVLSDSLTEAELKKSKWKDIENSTKRFSKLKYNWNKVKSSLHAFKNSFNKSSAVSNLHSLSKNNMVGTGLFIKNSWKSCLPSLSFSYLDGRRSNNVTQEMISLFMTGIELGDTAFNNFVYKKDNSMFLSSDFFRNQSFIFNKYNHAEGSFLNNENFNLGDGETISALRRFSSFNLNSVFDEENSHFFKNEQEVSSENLINNEKSNETDSDGKTEDLNSNNIGKKLDNIQKKGSAKSLKKNSFQLMKFSFFPYLSFSKSVFFNEESSTSFRIPQSKYQSIPIVNFSSWGKNNKKFLNVSNFNDKNLSLKSDDISLPVRSPTVIVSTGISNVDDDIENDENKNRKEIKNFKIFNNNEIGKESYLNSNQKIKQEILISSAYSFSSASGFSAESFQEREEEKLISEQKKASLYANVLVYQYRTIGLEPPLILRSPSSYINRKRIYIKAKPSLEEVHNDEKEENEDSSNYYEEKN